MEKYLHGFWQYRIALFTPNIINRWISKKTANVGDNSPTSKSKTKYGHTSNPHKQLLISALAPADTHMEKIVQENAI